MRLLLSPSIGAGQACEQASSQAGAQGNTWEWCRAWKWLEAPAQLYKFVGVQGRLYSGGYICMKILMMIKV